VASKPELKPAYEKMMDNAFWLEFIERVQNLTVTALKDSATRGVSSVGDVWSLAKSQGAYDALRTVLGLPESITGLRIPKTEKRS